jgi:allophanate hydrolase
MTDLTIASLRARFARGEAQPADVLATVYRRIAARGDDATWIHLVSEETAAARLTAAARRVEGNELPLFGIPFAVKDNIDVAGMPTTAACPDFAYMPARSAPAVQRLLDAGAICIGKTNMDQFATGLSGVRSPYGVCASVFDNRYASGGSSSGSAIAVAAGLVSFALGTDTGGSGRIPAGFNGIVGVKPTRGLVSSLGLVPACRTLDCVSVFALNCEDGARVLGLMAGFDPGDPFSRPAPVFPGHPTGGGFRFGYLGGDDLAFDGDDSAGDLYAAALERLAGAGGQPNRIDFAPFREAGNMMFEGPWTAERLAALGPFIEANPGSVLPVTRDIITAARRWSAADAFSSLYRLRELRRQATVVFQSIDVLVVPTAPRAWTIAEMQAEPVACNNANGRYSYFVNLLDQCAIAVPAGRRSNGVGMGITLIAPAWHDEAVSQLGLIFDNP